MVEEAEVLQILTQVNVVRRECEIVSARELILGTWDASFKMGSFHLMTASPSPPVPQKLEAANFDEKKEINKRKQLILEGKVRAEPASGGGQGS